MFSVRNKNKKKIISEINITPFVDIVLVILIVFMVTAPMLNSKFNINLPKSDNNSTAVKAKKQVIVYIDKDGIMYVDDKIVLKANLKAALQDYNKDNSTVYIQADKSVVYQSIIDVMSELYVQGFTNISLVTTQSG